MNEGTGIMDTLAWAKHYLSKGLSVIPITPGPDKKPYISWTPYQERRSTEAELLKWWTHWPNANIGIITGKISGIVVVDVDIDIKKGINGFETIKKKHLSLPPTPSVKTGRGGCHYYFIHPGGVVSNFQKRDDLPGIDFRGDGGYVVAPPSLHDSGRGYEWAIPFEEELAILPQWVLATKPQDKTPIKELLARGAVEGQRNDSLARIAGALFGIGLDYNPTMRLCLAWNDRNTPPMPEKEIKSTVKSIFKKHTQNSDIDLVSSEDRTKAPLGEPAPIDHWLNTEPPEIKEVFTGLLTQGIVGGLFAQGGTGKTYLLLCLMIAAATGQTFFRTFKPTRAVRVLGLLGEDPQAMIHRRLYGIIEDFDYIDKTLLATNLRLYCGKAAPFMILNSNNPSPSIAFDWLQTEVNTFSPDLIIIDPKSMFYGLEENSNDHNTQWINAIKELTVKGATVLFSHHVTKNMSGTLELNGARGGSALVDGSRFAANMRQLTKDDAQKFNIDDPWRYIEFQVTKNSYLPKLPSSIYFKFTKGGALEEVAMKSNLEFLLIEELLSALKVEVDKGQYFTARDIERKGVVLPDRTQRERKEAVELALRSGRLLTRKLQGTGRPKDILIQAGDILTPERLLLANMAQNNSAETII